MGVTGTDVAKEAADMMLTDDNFATIITAVREGRGIFANIRKFLRFLLSSNIGEVLTMFLGVMLAGVIGLDATGDAIAVPLLATHILWINLLTDSAPALALGVDPPPDDVMARPPRRLTDRIIDARMWTGIVWVGLVMARRRPASSSGPTKPRSCSNASCTRPPARRTDDLRAGSPAAGAAGGGIPGRKPRRQVRGAVGRPAGRTTRYR